MEVYQILLHTYTVLKGSRLAYGDEYIMNIGLTSANDLLLFILFSSLYFLLWANVGVATCTLTNALRLDEVRYIIFFGVHHSYVYLL